MKIKKVIAVSALAALLAAPLGCATFGVRLNHQDYKFEGMIGNEHVQFEEGVSIADAAAIVVKKPDGRKIIYWDDKADFSVDEVLIEMPDGTKSTYSRGSGSELDTVVISEAQGQYRDYLDKIYEINKKKGLESIK